ncbi:MAG: universal stress protein [Syntrophomonadaceae bacterium]|jgi:nucleotide-binding universal stress UspA family protein|nr:universal stress protein [Syntrophomonadaceae bacterium]
MIKKILVPTDGSGYSRRALKTAVEYSKVFGAEIEILHVVSEPLGIYDFNLYHVTDEQLEEAGKRIMAATSKDLDLSEVSFKSKVVSGYPASEIINAANDNVDLIVIGSQGRRPLVGALLGSVTQRVLAVTRCPVLVVK